MPSVVGNLVVQNSNGSFNLGDFITFLRKKTRKLIMGPELPMLDLSRIRLTVLVQRIHFILMWQIKIRLNSVKSRRYSPTFSLSNSKLLNEILISKSLTVHK